MALSFKVGSYTGNSSDPQTITGVGFQPKMVIVYTSLSGSGDSRASIFKTADMSTGSSGVTSNFGENGQQTSGLIDSFNSDGFLVRGAKNVSGTTYYYAAFGGSDVVTGTYTGNGSSRSITGLGFQPGWVIIEGNPYHTYHKNSGTGNGTNKTQFTSSVADTTNVITTLDSDGFSLGTDAGANNTGTTYYYFAIKGDSSYFYSSSYTGNGSSGKTVTGLGFQPTFVFIKRTAADQASSTTSAFTSTYASLMSAANPSTGIINSLDSDGFTLGTSSVSNANGGTYYFVGIKTPSTPPASGNANFLMFM